MPLLQTKHKTKKNKMNAKPTKQNSKLPAQSKAAPVNATKPAPAAIGQSAEETAPSILDGGSPKAPVLPPVENADDDKPADVQIAGDKKADGRGRPQGQKNSFTAAIGAILKKCPELKAMHHVLSQLRNRTGEEIQAILAATIAKDGVAALANPEFLASLAQEEMGDCLPLSRAPKAADGDKPEVLPGMLEKYGADFEITVSRGAVHKYFDNRKEGVFFRLNALTAEAPAAPGEVKADASSDAIGTETAPTETPAE